MYPQSSYQKYSKIVWVVLGVIVFLMLVMQFFTTDSFLHQHVLGQSKKQIAGASLSGYQAVFLTNGQVYFGKITFENDNYIVLNGIFYLKVLDPLQGTNANAGAEEPRISLVKLGSELHGPADEMHISRSQVLFYEDLKMDSSVVKNINDYNQTNKIAQ